MLMRLVVSLLNIFLVAGASWGQQSSSASEQRRVLEQILTQAYQPSVVGKQLMGIGSETAIRRAGIIIVVQRPGLYAALQRNGIASTEIHGLNASVFRGNKDYAVPVGERFYVTSISVGGETVFFGLLSARSITVPKGTGRLWAVATFYFPPETLANADKDTVIRALDAWFVPEGRSAVRAPAAGSSPQLGSALSAASPVPQPVTPPENLALGMSREQVVAVLGAPQREVSFAEQTWLNYAGMVVVLKGGKLVSIEQTGQPPARVAIHSDPAGAEIYMDGQLVGSTPSTLELPPGNHQVSVRLSGYQEWLRDLRVLAGSEIKLEARLEKK